MVAGITVVAGQAYAEAPVQVRANKTQIVDQAMLEDGRVDPNMIQITPGGSGEVEPVPGTRANPCTLGENNTFDRPAGTAPYATFIVGDFNFDEFPIADDIVSASNGSINRFCWRITYSNNICAVDGGGADITTIQGRWTINIYNFDTITGLPSTLIRSYNTGAGGGITATQGTTGSPTGFGGTQIEVSIAATVTGTNTNVVADTCYYVEFYWESFSSPCFVNLTLSYEGDEGNLSLLRRNRRFFPNYAIIDFTNLDTTLSVGFVNAAQTLSASNGPTGCFDRLPPPNDNLAGATLASCGQTIDFDNTYATHVAITPTDFTCRRGTIDPTEYQTGDVWWRINPNPNTSMQVSLCPTNTLGGLAGGDSLLSVYRLTTPPTVALSNLTVIPGGCSDDSCTAGLSQVDAVSLNTLPNGGANQNLYIRVASFNAIQKGQYTMSISCPIPVAANDLCTAAVNIPRVGAPGYSSVGGVQFTGQTRTASVDSNVINSACAAAANTARGVWYRLTGGGFQVRATTDVAISGTAFDTTLAVYCGTCSATPTLSCIAANDDFDPLGVNDKSTVEFCAKSGQDYYILVQGFGFANGDFGLRVEEVRDGSNNPIACCDPQLCGDPCDFEIPANALQENGLIGLNNTVLTNDQIEGCIDTTLANGTAGNPNSGQFNGGCTGAIAPPAGEERRFGTLNPGQTRFGRAWAANQLFDRDWYLSPIAPNVRSLMSYSMQVEGPTQLVPWSYTSNYDACTGLLAFASSVSNPVTCGFEFSRRFALDVIGARNVNGTQPGTQFAWRVQSTSESNYTCTGLTRYWLRLNQIFPMGDCPALPVPGGAQDETTIPTFNGAGPVGEQCIDPPATGGRTVEGCFATVLNDSEFLTLTPGTPIVGKVDSTAGAGGASRDIDFYKFTLTGRSIVRLAIDSPWLMTSLITENDCVADDQESYATAATLGNCGADGARAEDVVILNGAPNTYIVWVFASDAFSGGGGTQFTNILCGDSASQYILQVDTTPLPTCAGLPCSAGEVVESEVCGAEFNSCTLDNDGCSEAKFGATNVTLATGSSNPTDICGSLFSVQELPPTDTFTSDVDYYQFTVTTRQKLTFSGSANGPIQILVADTGAASGVAGTNNEFGGTNCYVEDVPVRVLDAIDTFAFGETGADQCNSKTESVYLEPGTYSIIAQAGTLAQGLATAAYNCVGNGTQVGQISYSISAYLEPVGSYCLNNNCLQGTQDEATAASGTGWTANQACPAQFTVANDATAYTTIAGTGGALQITGLRDDDFAASNMGASFNLYGVSYSPASIRISSNGYIFFQGDDETPANRAFANTAQPNAIIAPFWHDWQVESAVGAEVWIRTSGSVGSETTIIEWRNVARAETFDSRASFQVHLLRGGANDGAILFVYGGTTNLAKLDLADVSAGVEDASGLTGRDVTVDAGFRTGNRAFRLSPDLTTPPCGAPACCPGDADGSGAVNFSDITSVLANFGTNYPSGQGAGDADCSLQVNFSDITSVLANFNSNCN